MKKALATIALLTAGATVATAMGAAQAQDAAPKAVCMSLGSPTSAKKASDKSAEIINAHFAAGRSTIILPYAGAVICGY